MSSIDYQAYIQAEIEECARLAEVYQGEESDRAAPIEHNKIDHLKKLLGTPISQELRAVYLQEYNDLRAAIRAIAVVNLTRKDFYADASFYMIKEKERLLNFSKFLINKVSFISDLLEEEDLQTLDELQEEFISRKNESIDRIKAESGSTEPSLQDPTLIWDSMREVPDVDNKGMPVGSKRLK